jgi:hypothetical protein
MARSTGSASRFFVGSHPVVGGIEVAVRTDGAVFTRFSRGGMLRALRVWRLWVDAPFSVTNPTFGAVALTERDASRLRLPNA